MRQPIWLLHLILLLLLLVNTAANAASKEKPRAPNVINVDSVTILASSSMAVPITEISKNYSRFENVDVNAVYDATGELVLDIENGDPADIIITASKKHLDKLKEEGLLDPASITKIAANRLSIVASKQMKLEKSGDIKDVLTQIHNKTLMIIGEPETTSLGYNTVIALNNLYVWPKFEKRVVLAPTSTKTVDYIIKGESAGIVYTTDALLYRNELDNLGTIPDDELKPMDYYAAVVVSDNMDKARKYLKYLTSKSAKAVLTEHGFVIK